MLNKRLKITHSNGIEFNWSPSPDLDAARPIWITERLPTFFAKDDLRASCSFGQMSFCRAWN